MPLSRRASWILLPYILNEGCKRRARNYETQGACIIKRPILYFCLLPFEQTSPGSTGYKSLLCLSPKNSHLTTTCLPHRYYLTSLCWSHWHTHRANKCSTAAFQSVASTSESEKDLQIPKLFLSVSQSKKEKKNPSPPDFTVLYHQAITNLASSLLVLK